jgi:hypothetical protein
MIKRLFLFFMLCCSPVLLFSQDNPPPSPLRSLEDIFPSLTEEIKEQAFSPEGYFASYEEDFQLLESRTLDPHLYTRIRGLRPSGVVEFLFVLPYQADPLDLVDIYNGLRHIRALKGRIYHSTTRDADIPLFEDATRIESPKKTTAVIDPAPKSELPDSEIFYIRLKDANFGNTYYQAEITKTQDGFIYSLANNKDISFFLFTVMKSGRFVTHFYFEPLDTGTLIYCISAVDVSDFISSQINMTAATRKRIAVILGWVMDGLNGRL